MLTPLVTRLPMDLALAAEATCVFFQYRNPTIAARQTPTSAATALQAVATELDEPVVPAHGEDFKNKFTSDSNLKIEIEKVPAQQSIHTL
jgi:hypothetical protein